MHTPRIHVILGSIREGRSGEQVARWFMNTVGGTADATLTLVDLCDYPLPLFADAVTPSERAGGPHPNPDVQRWLDTVNDADGYIIVTPEYNHSIPSALKNALDYPYKEWNGKAVGFVSYGSAAGGARAVEHLRQIATELQMHDVRDQVLIPFVWNAFTEDGTLRDAERYDTKAHKLLTSVAALARTLRGTA